MTIISFVQKLKAAGFSCPSLLSRIFLFNISVESFLKFGYVFG